MTIDTLFLQNVDYPARLVRQLVAMQYDEGVMDLTAFKVVQRGAGANRSVDVSGGQAVVVGDDQTTQGNYLATSNAVVNVPLDPYPVSNSRYDLIILQVQDPDATGPAGDDVIVTKVTGTAASSPVIPALPASALLLAVVGPLVSSTSSVTTSLINDAQTGAGPAGVGNAHLQAGRRDSAGVMADFAGGTGTIPNGWLRCDGASVLRSGYPRLFATIGVAYGSADGTHFNLPDLRGRAGIGFDNMGTAAGDGGRLDTVDALNTSGGEQYHTLSATESGTSPHTHTVTDPGHPHGVDYQDGTGVGGSINITSNATGRGAAGTDNATANTTGVTIDNAVGAPAAASHNNMPPFLLVNKIIRT